MSVLAAVAGLLMSQALVPPVAVEEAPTTVDVAYAELARGDTMGAIARIEANREVSADDPAALINLGTAHARLGKWRKAEKLYRAAIASNDRYELELADGTWMDSRRAARIAMAELYKAETLAMR